MSARIFAALMMMGPAGCGAPVPPPAVGAAQVSALLAQCAGKDGWSDPAPPVRIHGGAYYVGTCGITAVLVTSARGHVLIDGATAEAAPAIAANIERLGFRLADVEVILNTHEHLDHAGGLAELQRRTGAKLHALAAARPALETGVVAASDPQSGLHSPFPGARVDRVVRDGERIRVGPLTLTAHATPGHAPGSTSWTWRSCDERDCRAIAYADSVSAVSHEAYRFSDHPDYVAAFRSGLAAIDALGCDLLLTPHPSASRLFERLGGSAPLAEAGACRAYAARGRAGLDARLAREAR